MMFCRYKNLRNWCEFLGLCLCLCCRKREPTAAAAAEKPWNHQSPVRAEPQWSHTSRRWWTVSPDLTAHINTVGDNMVQQRSVGKNKSSTMSFQNISLKTRAQQPGLKQYSKILPFTQLTRKLKLKLDMWVIIALRSLPKKNLPKVKLGILEIYLNSAKEVKGSTDIAKKNIYIYGQTCVFKESFYHFKPSCYISQPLQSQRKLKSQSVIFIVHCFLLFGATEVHRGINVSWQEK